MHHEQSAGCHCVVESLVSQCFCGVVSKGLPPEDLRKKHL